MLGHPGSNGKRSPHPTPEQFPAAELQPNPELAPMLNQVLSANRHPAALDLPFDLRATAFQMRVGRLSYHPPWRNPNLRPARQRDWPTHSSKSCSASLRHQPRRRSHPLPSSHRSQRQPDGIPLGHRTQKNATGNREGKRSSQLILRQRETWLRFKASISRSPSQANQQQAE